MSRKMDNAIALYMEGIRDGNVREAVTKYTGDRYTQHSTGVADGVEGFVEFFLPFIERNPVRDIRIVRAIDDGQYVFVQAYQDINNGEAKWITTDLFDTDEDDKIIEHWDVISPVVESTVSGHSQIDGPTDVTDLDKTAQNKQRVHDFVHDVLLAGNTENLSRYLSDESFIQHNPLLEDGADAFAALLQNNQSSDRPMVDRDVFKIVGQGNFVVSYSKMSMGEDEFAIFDIFRLQDGLIVEHWDNSEKILPASEWGNSGKF